MIPCSLIPVYQQYGAKSCLLLQNGSSLFFLNTGIYIKSQRNLAQDVSCVTRNWTLPFSNRGWDVDCFDLAP